MTQALSDNADDLGRLAYRIAQERNDSVGIALLLERVIEKSAWTSKGFKSLRECIEAPHSRDGLNTTITVVMGHADVFGNVAALLRKQAVAEGWYDEIIAKMKAAQAKVRIDAIAPPLSHGEKQRAGWITRRAGPRDETPPVVRLSVKTREAANFLRKRAEDATHPDHQAAAEQFARVMRGELNAITARRRVEVPTTNDNIARAKLYARKLDATTRAEFLQWLVDQGAVLSLVPNPKFAGFTDGRKPKPST